MVKFRNEIVHASFNKDLVDLNEKIEITANEGYRLADLISRYVNKIKTNNEQVSIRDKWQAIEKSLKYINLIDKKVYFNTTNDY